MRGRRSPLCWLCGEPRFTLRTRAIYSQQGRAFFRLPALFRLRFVGLSSVDLRTADVTLSKLSERLKTVEEELLLARATVRDADMRNAAVRCALLPWYLTTSGYLSHRVFSGRPFFVLRACYVHVVQWEATVRHAEATRDSTLLEAQSIKQHMMAMHVRVCSCNVFCCRECTLWCPSCCMCS
jgi:hypothetical protein